MEKIYFTGGINTVNDPVWSVLRLLQEKENEIVAWINDHEKYVEPLEKAWQEAVEQTLKQAMEKEKQKQPKATIAGKPQVLRYELSHDGVGLIAFLADGISYHIHSYDLTPDQVQIRNQLIDMAGMKG